MKKKKKKKKTCFIIDATREVTEDTVEMVEKHKAIGVEDVELAEWCIFDVTSGGTKNCLKLEFFPTPVCKMLGMSIYFALCKIKILQTFFDKFSFGVESHVDFRTQES